jgi:uncharacterized PurR-regulated membrane protein YhhQ (DUF165 family)
MLVCLYLAAIVVANLAVARFGPPALIVSAFVLIPFDLCTRDVLHERWEGRSLSLKMGILIASGSLISYALSASAVRVAHASAIAFTAAATIDALVYWGGRGLTRFLRMNLSNACSSITDSIIFPVVAFGSTTFSLSAAQTGAKFCGGLIWSWLFITFVLRRPRRRLVS